jgi:hypothetical protein
MSNSRVPLGGGIAYQCPIAKRISATGRGRRYRVRICWAERSAGMGRGHLSVLNNVALHAGVKNCQFAGGSRDLV